MTTTAPNLHSDWPNRRIALVWLALCFIFCAVGMDRIMDNNPLGPDDALRIVQVRDLLAGQGWFDLHQYRINPEQGTWMHWSRLVDIPLAFIIGFLSPLLGSQMAETVALIIVPLLTLGAISLVIGRLAWRLLGLEVATFSCLLIGFVIYLSAQLQPFRIDHHAWQVFTACLALAAMAGRKANPCGVIAGLAMAAGMSISLELLPVAGIFGIALLWRWVQSYEKRWWLVAYLNGLAIGLLPIFIATRGISDLVQYCDVVSPAHMTFFASVAITTTLIARFSRRLPTVLLLGALGISGLAGLALFAWSAPQCLASPFGQLDPLVREYWYLNVLEGRPLWEQDLSWALPIFFQLLVAIMAAIALARRDQNGRGTYWCEYALILTGVTIQALFVWRSATVAGAIATIPLAWLMVMLLSCLRKTEHIGQKVAAALLVMLVLLPSSPVQLYKGISEAMVSASTANGSSETNEIEIKSLKTSLCKIRDQADKLDRFPQGTIFAPLDIGPAILLKSDHAVVATGHHRANLAMRDVITAFTSSPDQARTIINAHDAQYVAVCTDLNEWALYAQTDPDSLANVITNGEAPSWLEPLPLDGPEEFKIWRVIPSQD